MQSIQTLSALVGVISMPLVVYFLRGILEEFKELKKAVHEIDKRVTKVEFITTKN